MSDVREGPGVHEHGSALHRLHQRRRDRFLHEDRECASDAEVVCCDRLAGARQSDDHRAKTLAHIPQAGSQREDSHDLGRDGDVESSGA